MRMVADNVPEWCVRCLRYMMRGDPAHACVEPPRAIYDVSTDPVPRLEPRQSPAEAAIYGAPTSDNYALWPRANVDGPARQEGYIQGIDRSLGIIAEHGGDVLPASDIYDRLKSFREFEVAAYVEEMEKRGRAAYDRIMSACAAPAPIAGTPSTMLGEALAHIQRARDLLLASGHYRPAWSAMESLEEVKRDVRQLRDALEKREADAREVPK